MKKNHMTSLFVALVVFAVSFIGVPASVQAEPIVKLGQTILLDKKDYSADIPLFICRRVDQVQVKANKGIFLKEIKVKFNNGEERTFQSYRYLMKNETSKWRDFGKTRCVTHIKVYGRANNNTAGVTVYGKNS